MMGYEEKEKFYMQYLFFTGISGRSGSISVSDSQRYVEPVQKCKASQQIR